MSRTVGRFAALTLALATVAACATANPTPSPSPDAGVTWPSDTSYGRLFAQVGTDGLVTKEVALQAFSTVIAPLPGVPAAQGGPPRDEERHDATFAINWLLPYIDQLTPEQRAVVDKALAPSPTAIVIPPELPVAFVGPGAPPQPKPPQADARYQPYLDAIQNAKGTIASRLHRDLQVPVEFDFGIGSDPTFLAFAYPTRNGFGVDRRCQVRATPLLEGQSQLRINVAMAHEVFHCFQYDVLRGKSAVGAMSWIIEGQAEWVGEDVAGPGPDGRAWWANYLASPTTSLFKRTYDGVGFYEHLTETGTSPWSIFDAMLANAYNGSDAFKAAQAVDDGFLDTWASGVFRVNGLPAAWYAHERWNTQGSAPNQAATISNGDSQDISADIVTTQPWLIITGADVTELAFEGHVRMHAGDQEVPQLKGVVYLCTQKGVARPCQCPEKFRYSGPPLSPGGDDGTVWLGVTGSLAPSSGRVRGHPMSDFCIPEEKPQPQGGEDPCAQGCASSIGDPHYDTLDQRGYDFQAAGEFMLLRSPDGAMEIQARQVAFPDVPNASITTALAWRVAGHRVRMYAEGEESGYALWLDDTQLQPASTGTIDLGGGAALTALDSGIEVAYGDGTIATAVFQSGTAHALNIFVAPSETFRAQATGLLSRIAPNSELPALPDGSALQLSTDRATRHAQRYQQLATAWHVTDQTSLFDYKPGETTATFDVPGFPSLEVAFTAEEFVEQQQEQQGSPIFDAMAQCAGVEGDEKQFFKCVFDILVTKDPAYANVYALLQQFMEEGPKTLEGPTVVFTPPPLPTQSAGLPAGFQQIVTDVSLVKGAAIDDAGRLYVSYTKPDFSPAFIVFDTNTDSVAATYPATGTGSVTLVGGSVWLAQDDSTGNGNCSVRRLDTQTLTEVAKVAIECDLYSNPVGVADGIWWVDPSAADAEGNGGMLRHIDPATNAVDRAVALPFLNGLLSSSATTVFYGDRGADKGWYRLVPGATAFERLPLSEEVFDFEPAGDGVWTQPEQGGFVQSVADFITTSTTPDRIVEFDEGGLLVAADDSAVYVDYRLDDAEWLARHPIDGSPATTVLNGASITTDGGSADLGYVDDDRLVLGAGRIAQLWIVDNWPVSGTASLVVQSAQLP